MRLNRRFETRIPLETYVNAYVLDRPRRGVTANISEFGLFLHTLVQDSDPPLTPVGVELCLPGTHETLWVSGETCRETYNDFLPGLGIRFRRMAQSHRNLLRAYCRELRAKALLG